MSPPTANLGTPFLQDEPTFPPLRRSHVLHCSYHYWHPRYRAITPKARLIFLTPPFVSYLRADGIILPPESPEGQLAWSDNDSGICSSTDTASEPDEGEEDPSTEWREIHDAIKTTISELGGKVVPKLNWSAPKDATWISATNSMECRTPDDVYLLLKSSNFITHDLEYAFDGCVDDENSTVHAENESPVHTGVPYCLVLRKHILLNPSLEFRCFVRKRQLIAICQRDLNYFEFLGKMRYRLRDRIQDFFSTKLRDTFPDENYVFDVYIPPPHQRVWLIDINPWALRTDSLLYTWPELLTLPDPVPLDLRKDHSNNQSSTSRNSVKEEITEELAATLDFEGEGIDVETSTEAFPTTPVFRLVKRDDPEAYLFRSPQYSAHKMPRDVVDASQTGEGGLRELAQQWNQSLALSSSRA